MRKLFFTQIHILHNPNLLGEGMMRKGAGGGSGDGALENF